MKKQGFSIIMAIAIIGALLIGLLAIFLFPAKQSQNISIPSENPIKMPEAGEMALKDINDLSVDMVEFDFSLSPLPKSHLSAFDFNLPDVQPPLEIFSGMGVDESQLYDKQELGLNISDFDYSTATSPTEGQQKK
ncbi:MAG TPA: hypothetical protein PKM84_02840 [Candidatus Pacearchaeota archaeon]|nr:hypothetical protein [Candidatus Pacearchaeota archaeon]